MTTTTHKPDTFYPDSRNRLLEIATTDAAILRSFDAMVESSNERDDDVPDDDPRLARRNAAMGVFMADIARLNISMNYVFMDRGDPYLAA